jgi:hypothetical protein
MANKKSNADIDLEDMSMEQLAEQIKMENSESSNPPVEYPITDTTAVEEEPQTEETLEEEAATEETPVVDESEPEFIRGKSRAEIAKMWQDSQAMISKQGNEKHDIMSKLEALERKVNTPVVQEKKDELMEQLSNYNQDDIKVIETLVERKLDSRNKAQQELSAKELKANTESNEMFWSNLEAIDPALSLEMKENILGAIRKDRSSTLETKGWLQSYVVNYRATKAAPVKPKVNLTTKKLKARTAGSGSQPAVIKKSVADMTADEFAVHAGLERKY